MKGSSSLAFESNFSIMKRWLPTVARLGAEAEDHYQNSPNICVYRLRQLGEVLAREVGRERRLYKEDRGQAQFIKHLYQSGAISQPTKESFFVLLRAGNKAVHEFVECHKMAAEQLRVARNLCVRYAGLHGAGELVPPVFRLPPKPKNLSKELALAYREQELLAERLKNAEAKREYEAQQSLLAADLERPKVVFAEPIWPSLNRLESSIRASIESNIRQFQDNPDPSSLQQIAQADDKKFHTLKLNSSLEMVVAISPDKLVYLCCYVGTKEQVNSWVKHRRIEVHPVLGQLQLFQKVVAPEPTNNAVFSQLSDEELSRCGVPQVLLPVVRVLSNKDQLLSLAGSLPSDSLDALVAVLQGLTVPEACETVGLVTPSPEIEVDTSDFDFAVAHRSSQRQFAQVDGSTLEQMLKQPMEVWRIYLHPSQKKVVKLRANGPVRVLGGAGTGKTVALLHRAAHLLNNEFRGPEHRLLVTTYTKAMTSELGHQLSKLVTEEQLKKVQVATLHTWASSLLRGEKIRFSVVQKKVERDLWKRAHAENEGAFDRSFLKEEWSLVVQNQGISTRSAYFRARRRGRGTPLNRKGRAAVWKALSKYRALLDEKGLMEWSDVIRLAKQTLKDKPQLRTLSAVLVDEVQDFGPQELRLLREMVPEQRGDLFLAGDSHQQIYRLGTSLKACGINIIGRSHRLRVNYRTTEKIHHFAMGVLPKADSAEGDLKGYRSLRAGSQPRFLSFASRELQLDALVRQVQNWREQGVAASEICVATRLSWLLKAPFAKLKEAGLATCNLKQRERGLADDAVRLSTLHSLKGSEFSRVLLIDVHAKLMPLSLKASTDAAALEDHEISERCLLYVAATRARDELVVMKAGPVSPFLTNETWEDPGEVVS